MADKLQIIIHAHADAVDSLVGEFTDGLDKIVNRATSTVISSINSEVSAAGGLVDSTRANQKFFAGLDNRFEAAMEAEGYDGLLDGYVESFNGQFTWFHEVINEIGQYLQNPLPKITFGRTDVAELRAQQLGAKPLIRSAVERASFQAKQRALLSVNGMPLKQLAASMKEAWATSVPESQNLADTSVSTFYRTITDKGYQIIEKDLPGFEVRYKYYGPLDKLTRPFCTKLEKEALAGKTWTRAMIDRMKNGQLPNVFTTCGGFRCRHQWVIAIPKDAKFDRKEEKPSREGVSRRIAAERALHKTPRPAHPHEQIKEVRERVGAAIKNARSERNV